MGIAEEGRPFEKEAISKVPNVLPLKIRLHFANFSIFHREGRIKTHLEWFQLHQHGLSFFIVFTYIKQWNMVCVNIIEILGESQRQGILQSREQCKLFCLAVLLVPLHLMPMKVSFAGKEVRMNRK